MEKDVINWVRTVILLFILQFSAAFGQEATPPLERKVTVSFDAIELKQALQKIELAADFSFAYKTGVFDEKMLINRAYINKTVREILDDIFQGSILMIGKGNYILLKANPKTEGSEITIEGYVMNAQTKEKIAFATVYETQTLSSAVSDEYGHYVLKLNGENQSFITAKKNTFQDTNLIFNPTDSRVVTLFLNPILQVSDSLITETPIDTTNFLTRFQRLKWLKFTDERKANMSNFKDFIQQKGQFSLLPKIGTNGKLSSATTVDYSFNLLGGVVGGVRKFELAGLFNIDVDTVKYGQIAGLFNVVGGHQSGVQIAGLFNSNLSDFKGVQIAGISNIVNKGVYGIQIGGIANKVKGNFYGIQIGGIVNYNQEKTTGIQVGGISNFCSKNSKVIQIGGISNFCLERSKAIQIGGIYNHIAKNSSGIQIAGIANYAEKNYTGIQVSGILNKADTLKGSQIGFINYSNHITGIPVGFLSFSKSGIHQLEIATTESLPIQIGLKTGVPAFYNSLFLSGRFTSSQNIFGLGYGIGSSVKLNDRNRFCFDLQSIYLVNSAHFDENYLNKFTVTYQFQVKKKFAVAIGPSLNLLTLRNIHANASSELKQIAPYSLYEKTTVNGRFNQLWIGGTVAIQLF
jgi:hypothetical protein